MGPPPGPARWGDADSHRGHEPAVSAEAEAVMAAAQKGENQKNKENLMLNYLLHNHLYLLQILFFEASIQFYLLNN